MFHKSYSYDLRQLHWQDHDIPKIPTSEGLQLTDSPVVDTGRHDQLRISPKTTSLN